MPGKVRVIANNDIAYLWWSVPKKIPGCLGFSVHREIEGKAPKPLPAWVGFEKGPTSKVQRDTDVWPIQSFQWKDVLAPRTDRFRYLIYAVRGTPQSPLRDSSPVVTTPFVALEEQFGKVRVVFNRGLLATQAMNRGSDAPASNAKRLRTMIGTPGNKVRLRLTRELLPTVVELLARARNDGGTCHCALYELTDEELIAELERTRATELVLSNANSSKKVDGQQTTVYDGTNAKARKRLREDDDLDVTDRLLKGNSIGHNKFVLYEDAQRRLQSVLTGSTNWTSTGLCGQTNNALLVDDEDLASHYFAYWTRLRNEQGELQGQPLRTWARANPLRISLGHGEGTLKVWFSPNTKAKTKDAKSVPVDMREVFDIVAGAKKAVLFLLFNPGTPSIVDKVKDVAAARAKRGEPLYVRGAISDPRTAAAGAVRVFSRAIGKRADTVITGVSGVPDDFGYWERELLKLGHAVIHDKVLVVDPFSSRCAVVTGSHNLGFKASYSNDENMVIIRGNPRIAEAFAAHVLDVVNHYKWRYKLQQLAGKGRLQDAWQDLEDDDRWQDKYFNTGFLESRDRFVLS
jgi:phosphatidylserine/phosphatidylglycerophosphate/cardiolipin synthase-like enzyme